MENKIEISRLDDTNRVFMHYHNFLEIAYVLSGDAHHTMDGKSTNIRRGNYFVVDYHTAHHYTSPKQNLTIINCLFLPEFIDPSFTSAKSFNELCERYYFKTVGRRINGPASNIIFEDDGSVGKIFLKMHKEYTEQKEGYHCDEVYSYGLAFSSGDLNAGVKILSEIMPDMLRLAEVEKTCQLLSSEIEKTRRRVNALEYVMIPDYEDTIKYITMKLEEAERSNITRLLKIKDMMLQQTYNYETI